MLTISDIQIVTVAYNSTGVIGDMLASVPDGVRIVIVDNASEDAEALDALARQNGAQVVSNSTNRGFGAACNKGSQIGDSTFLFFVNPDAQIAPGCFEAMLAAALQNPEAGAFTPRVLDRKGKLAFRRRSRLLPKSEHWTGPPPTDDADIPLLNGAAIFVKREYFHGVGGFDEAIFLYHEDDDLSLRLRAAYGPLRYVSHASVVHAEGHSTVRSPATAAFKAFHMAQSAIYAMQKHGLPRAQLRIRIFAVAQLLSPVVLFSRRKRAKNLGFLKGAFSTSTMGATAGL